MKLPIKVGNKVYYMDSDEWETEEEFIKQKEIEFVKNVRKGWLKQHKEK